jgi:hypothetical protein
MPSSFSLQHYHRSRQYRVVVVAFFIATKSKKMTMAHCRRFLLFKHKEENDDTLPLFSSFQTQRRSRWQ